MVNGNLGSVSFMEQNVLAGNNHIVVPYLVKDGQKNLRAGTAVKLTDGKVEHLTVDTDDAIGVLYETVDFGGREESKDDSAVVVVFGSVKKHLVKFKEEGTDCTAALVEKLRKNGVYVLG